MTTTTPSQPAPLGLFPGQPTPRLYDAVVETLRIHHYSLRTEEAYIGWIRRFLRFHPGRNPRDMGSPELTAFLSHLATTGSVAASTQNQALSSLLFLYQKVLKTELRRLDEVVRAKRPRRLPVVLTRGEVRRVLAERHGVYSLIGRFQELPGHASVEATMIYAHVLNRGGRGVQSPLDAGMGIDSIQRISANVPVGAMSASRDSVHDEQRPRAAGSSPQQSNHEENASEPAMRRRR